MELAKKSCAQAAAGAYSAVVPNGSNGSQKFCDLAAVGSSWGCQGLVSLSHDLGINWTSPEKVAIKKTINTDHGI